MKRNARMWTTALVVALAVGPSAAHGQVTYTTVVQAGPAPGTARNFSPSGAAAFTSVAINAFAQVSFIGTLSGNTIDDRGLWSGTAGAIQLHARENSPSPGGGGIVFGDVFTHNVTGDNGRVSFHNTSPPSPTVNGVWEGAIGAPLNVALQGQTVPGSNPPTQFSLFPSPNFRGGRVASRTSDNTNAQAVFAGGAGNFQLVARPGDAVPNIPTATFAGFGLPLVNRNGIVAFDAIQSVVAGNGIFAYPVVGAGRAVVHSGDLAGDIGGTFSSSAMELKGYNDAGQVAFRAQVTGGPSSGAIGVFVNDSVNRNDSRLITRIGAAAPGASGATFSSIGFTPLGGGGHVAFTGIVEGSGITSNNDSGLWIGSSLATLRAVVRENDQAPGMPAGVVFSDLSTNVPVVNAAGTVAFLTRLRGPGITIGVNDQVLFATDGLGNLRLVAREGSVPAIPGVTTAVAPGGIHFVHSFNSVGGQDGKPTSLNDRGQIAFGLDLEGTNTDRVVIASIPQQGKVINGTFANGALDPSWTITGPGTAVVADGGGGNLAARLTAGSPVTMSQDVDTLLDPFNIEFDYRFTTTTGTLDILLDGTTLATVLAPGVLGGFTHIAVPVSDPSLFNRLDIPLAFRLDGPTGSQVFIDNVTMVPEPGSLVLAGVVGLGLAIRSRRRRGFVRRSVPTSGDES